MVRTSIAGILGLILVFIEAYIVMNIKGYYTIEFGGMAPFISVWAMNVFLILSILTHLKIWYNNRELARGEASSEY